MKTMIQGGWVVGFGDGTHRIWENGQLVLEDDRVVFVGYGYPGRADRMVDARGKLVCPGFINTHAHVGVEINVHMVDRLRAGSRARGLGVSAEYALGEQGRSLSRQQMRASAAFGLAQLLRTGSTTVIDAGGSGTIWWLGNPPEDEEMLVDVAGEMGARLYVALAFRDYKTVTHPDGRFDYLHMPGYGRDLLDQAIAFVEKYGSRHEDRVRAFISPHAVDNNSPSLLSAAREAATELRVPIEVHCAQSVREVETIFRRHGTTPVGLLHEIGFLGPDVILGHAIFLSGHPVIADYGIDDLAILRETGTSVAHSPLPFLRGGDILHSLPRYIDAGVNVSVGTDMWPVDIIEEMRTAWYLGKVASGEPDRPSAEEVFEAATIGGARALGRTDIGRLAPGAKADVVVIDLTRFHYGPITEPIRALLTSGRGEDVERVFIDGREVVQAGCVRGVDMPALQRQADEVMEALIAAAVERDWAGRSRAEFLPRGHFTSPG